MKPSSIKKLPPHLRPKTKFVSIFRYLTPDANSERIYPNDPRYDSAEFDEIIVMNEEWTFAPPGYKKAEWKDLPKDLQFV